jgi:hypothetical protein
MAACRVCGSPANQLFAAMVLKKYDVSFDRCTACGFIQSEQPYWLAEAYSDAINEVDIGLMYRGINAAALTEGVILSCFDPYGRFLDYGAGYGVLVRMMRDRGYDFRWLDANCENIFAKHFPHESGGKKYDLITAFEVFEHLDDPIVEIGKMLDLGDNILFSTMVPPAGVKRAEDWWYFGVDHGQHIAFYSLDALQSIAARFGLFLTSDGIDTHLLSKERVSPRVFKLFARHGKGARIYRALLRRRKGMGSLLMPDVETISRVSA